MPPVDQTAIEQVFRAEYGRAVAVLVRVFGDIDLAEESVQDAFTVAAARWPSDGMPPSPAGWIITTARNRAIDRLRREASRNDRHAQARLLHGYDEPPEEVVAVRDDRLRLIFTCCHPALNQRAQVALTLRLLGGLETPEIARAFLVPEATMSKRLTRTKAKIAAAGIPYRVPPAHLLPERTAGVLAVLYLMFNEGYSASAGERLIRAPLCVEAIRLARLLRALMRDEPEASGLLALMLLQHSRRGARLDESGDIVTLEEQDRSRWDSDEIDEATALLRSALRRRAPGPYQLQAAIAACHAEAPNPAATDWPQIAALYELMLQLTPSPVVRLNRAVAVAMAEGLDAGLALVDELAEQGTLTDYHLLEATRADLHRRRGDRTAAIAAYHRALDAARTEPERRFILRRLAEQNDRR